MINQKKIEGKSTSNPVVATTFEKSNNTEASPSSLREVLPVRTSSTGRLRLPDIMRMEGDECVNVIVSTTKPGFTKLFHPRDPPSQEDQERKWQGLFDVVNEALHIIEMDDDDCDDQASEHEVDFLLSSSTCSTMMFQKQ